jgi:uncharacterized protein YfaS (alpha-2-macroglobulin family)
MFIQSLPETDDHQAHRAEIKIDGLPAGQYALLTSSDSVFSEKGFMAINTFFCSSIAFVVNGLDYFVLDRNSGHPLKGVKIKASFRENKNGHVTYKQGKIYQSAAHGYFQLVNHKGYSEQRLEFYFGKDYLSDSRYLYNNYKDDDDDDDYDKDRKSYEADETHDFLFMDRSIYRPVQTVYFKGLLVTKDFKTRAQDRSTKRNKDFVERCKSANNRFLF